MGLSSGARAALTAAVKGVSRDVAHANVTINNLCPERFDTDRQRQMAELASAVKGITIDEAYDEIRATIAAAAPRRPGRARRRVRVPLQRTGGIPLRPEHQPRRRLVPRSAVTTRHPTKEQPAMTHTWDPDHRTLPRRPPLGGARHRPRRRLAAAVDDRLRGRRRGPTADLGQVVHREVEERAAPTAGVGHRARRPGAPRDLRRRRERSTPTRSAPSSPHRSSPRCPAPSRQTPPRSSTP